MISAPISPLPLWTLLVGITFVMAGREWSLNLRRRAMNMALHELRRPLQVLVLDQPEGIESAPGGSMLALAIDALGDLDRELNGTGREGPALQRLDLAAMINSCARRWRSRASLANASISVQWQGPSAVVLGDPAALSRALDNLVINAIEHGGPTIEITGAMGVDDAEVEVLDSGSEHQSEDRLDSPAHVIERLSGRNRHGHGLAVVERAVREHGGQFDLKLSPQGSRADIRLPVVSM
jgi:signal transduction histidine kinase